MDGAVASFVSLEDLPLFGDDIESVDLGQYFNVSAPIKIEPQYPMWDATLLDTAHPPVMAFDQRDNLPEYASGTTLEQPFSTPSTSDYTSSESFSPHDSPFYESPDIGPSDEIMDILPCVPSLPALHPTPDENAAPARPHKRKAACAEASPTMGDVLAVLPGGGLMYEELNKLELEHFERCVASYRERGYVTDAVDKQLRKVRRKIKGRVYAKERRQTKKQREGSIEDRNLALLLENAQLKDSVVTLGNKVEILTSENTRLRGQMAQLAIYYQKNTGSSWGFTPNKKRAVSAGATLCAVLFFAVCLTAPGAVFPSGAGPLEGAPSLATGRVILQFEPDTGTKYFYDLVKVSAPRAAADQSPGGGGGGETMPGSFVECDYRNACYLYKPKPDHRNTYTRHLLSELGGDERPANHEATRMLGIPFSQLNETLHRQSRRVTTAEE